MPLLDEPSLLDELLAQVRSADPATKEVVEVALKQWERLPWVPNIGPQTDAYDSPADETFYGGQAGGGKTDLGLGLAINAHARSLILRRINKDAVKLVERAADIIGHRNGYNGQLQRWRFGGKLIEFGGCEQEIDKQRYKGDPHDLIVFDEAAISWNRSFVSSLAGTGAPSQDSAAECWSHRTRQRHRLGCG